MKWYIAIMVCLFIMNVINKSIHLSQDKEYKVSKGNLIGDVVSGTVFAVVGIWLLISNLPK